MMRSSVRLLPVCLLVALAACSAILPKSAPLHPKFGAETSIRVVTFEGRNGAKANGNALLHQFENGTAVITITLNVLPPPEGEVYVAELGGAEPVLQLGPVRSATQDARHRASIQREIDITPYKVVSIYKRSREAQDSGGILIAEGMATEPGGGR